MKRVMLVILASCLGTQLIAEEGVVNLGSTVAGNQEQPKVLYIVPWQSPEADLDFSQTLNSQLNAVFDHVERSELQRQIRYLKAQKDAHSTSGQNIE